MRLKPYWILVAVFVGGILVISLYGKVHPISVNDLWKHVGKRKKVITVIERTFKHDNGSVSLYPQGAGDVVFEIDEADIDEFPANPELVYRGKKVRVQGLIKQQGQRFVISLTRRDQIKVFLK